MATVACFCTPLGCSATPSELHSPSCRVVFLPSHVTRYVCSQLGPSSKAEALSCRVPSLPITYVVLCNGCHSEPRFCTYGSRPRAFRQNRAAEIWHNRRVRRERTFACERRISSHASTSEHTRRRKNFAQQAVRRVDRLGKRSGTAVAGAVGTRRALAGKGRNLPWRRSHGRRERQRR